MTKKIQVSIDLLVKLRNLHQELADAYNEELELHDPNTTTAQTKIMYEQIPWTMTKNQKQEPYERYPAYQQQPDTTNINYTALLAKLKENKGFNKHNGLNYWLFQDGITIGRKPATTK